MLGGSPIDRHGPIITTGYANVSHTGDASIKHKMDVFIPPGTHQLLPCAAHMHGGGFSAGKKVKHCLHFVISPELPFAIDFTTMVM